MNDSHNWNLWHTHDIRSLVHSADDEKSERGDRHNIDKTMICLIEILRVSADENCHKKQTKCSNTDERWHKSKKKKGSNLPMKEWEKVVIQRKK